MIAAHRQTQSSEVDLALLINGREISLHAIGPDSITLREATSLSASEAQIRMTVDGRESLSRVRLLDGSVSDDLEVAVQLLTQ